MLLRIDDTLLQSLKRPLAEAKTNAGAAREVVGKLGALARWWLHDDVLEAAASGRDDDQRRWLLATPSLPTAKGSCWIAIAQRPGGAYPYPWLRPAFALPLQWVPGPGGSALPPALRMIVADVLATLGLVGEWSAHIALNDSGREYDLSGLIEDLDFASGWAPLAGGLMAACAGGLPDTAVWASGVWKNGAGIDGVAELEAKLELAKRHDAQQFFLPESQIREVSDHASRLNIELGALTQGERKAHDALREYAKTFRMEPDEGAPLDDQWAWYDALDEKPADEFLRKRLLPSIVKDVRDCYQQEEGAELPVIRRFVTISNNITLGLISVGILKPEQCLLLHSKNDVQKRIADETRREIRKRVPSVEVVKTLPFDNDLNLAPEVASAVAEFTRGIPAEQVGFDITPGTKLMTLSLAHDLAADNNLLFYVKHDRPRGTGGRTSKIVRGLHRIVVRSAARAIARPGEWR